VVTLEDILDVLVALEALELESYRRAMMRMTDDMLQQLEDLLEKMQEAIRDTDYELYATSAMNFRNTLIAAADSPRLSELIAMIRLTGNRIRLRSIIIPLRGHSSLEEHERITEAIRKGDLPELEAAYRHHMESLRRDTEKHWDFIRP
jgi:DNA-binding GntR family transcriptional regulator